jgi:predicted AlkP superfamily pyrophosphatase or phosphodiesterase
VSSAGPNAQCSNNGTCHCNPANEGVPSNGIIYVDDNVWIEGSFPNSEQKLTVAAGNGKAFLGNNSILYANHDGRNVLGIIAQSDVEVIKNSQNILQIDGALLAQNGQVGRAHYGPSYKNSITINGSIATKQRYGFAWTDGTGYANRNLNAAIFSDRNGVLDRFMAGIVISRREVSLNSFPSAVY